MNRHKQDGFTLVELMMAMAVFSFMLMIITSGIIQALHSYEAGVVARATQQNVRLVADDFSKAARESSLATVGSGSVRACLQRGSQVVAYGVDTNHNLRRVESGSCPTAIDNSWSTVNDQSAAVTQFDVTKTPAVGGGLGTVSLQFTLAAVADLADLDSTGHCQNNGAGSQFCSATTIVTTVAMEGN